MAKCKDGTFYATVVVDMHGGETVLYNGANPEQMKKQYASLLKLRQSYLNIGEQFTMWNYDEGKEVVAERIEQRHYAASKNGSIDRQQKGLKGEYTVLESTSFVEEQKEAEPVEQETEATPQPKPLIVKAKIWNAYRPCEVMAPIGNYLSVRVIYPIQGMTELHDVSLEAVRKADQQAVLERYPEIVGAYRVTLKETIKVRTNENKLVTIKAGSAYTTKNLLIRDGRVRKFFAQAGEQYIPVQYLDIQSV